MELVSALVSLTCSSVMRDFSQTGAVHRPVVILLNVPHGLQVTMVMTDVEGSTQLWEQDSSAADQAIAMHDSILRGMLPTYFGFEVR